MKINFLFRVCINISKKILPESFFYFFYKKTGMRKYNNIEKNSLDTKFSLIYKQGIWSPEGVKGDFYSGTGSHDLNIVIPYTKAVIKFLENYDKKLDVVDLGCGDFNVGSKLRPYTNNYIACDIVKELIERNKIKYCNSGVEFDLINIVDDELPDGEIVFIRQVLQHLSNADILNIIPKLYKYKFLILTEHIPNNFNFIPNKNFTSGPSIRLERNSGVVITAPPFNLIFKEKKEIFSIQEGCGNIVTILYTLK